MIDENSVGSSVFFRVCLVCSRPCSARHSEPRLLALTTAEF
jgi:hypothetical protein